MVTLEICTLNVSGLNGIATVTESVICGNIPEDSQDDGR